MVLTHTARCITAALMVALLWAPLVGAQQSQSAGRGGVGLDATVEQLRRETGGRVLHAETRRNQGRDEHHVRIITERGKVKRYRIDAGSGAPVPRDYNKRR